ncbi:hypothetical protein [Roseiflexus castenholzii]|uniref:Uncharacterized protein n=1 Tax=Roseiflexus castenholzii (strain DSM 13941 / HLO8) TaxID=383372 RepID=A7NHM1_ROSCS|nr:hypothetical protein [Roseiflexus castenholzii]ABU56968.1 hypothetical protein Rcas_0852 [Roseiflexus castenholzii DSM 13941]
MRWRCLRIAAAILHHDRPPNRAAEATAAFQRLQYWRDAVHRRLQSAPAILHITTRQRVYRRDNRRFPAICFPQPPIRRGWC